MILNNAVELMICSIPAVFSTVLPRPLFTQKVRLETHVVRRCKALQAAAWQRHARFEATQQVRSNCVFQGERMTGVPWYIDRGTRSI